MSLTDALLLDPHRESREVWIAPRTDGAKGSGVQSDPYDGSTIYSTPLSITNLTTPDPTNKPLEAQATTSAPHGLEDNDVVIISGAGANGDWYDGWFLAYDTHTDGTTKFKYKMRFKAAADSAAGRVVQKPLSYRFDERMAELGEKTTIHLSPGVFETRGHSGADGESYGWRPKSGFCIRGAGMGLTTLKLVGAAVRERQYSPVNTGTFLDGFEVSDLTMDCNLEGQPNPDVVCAAVSLRSGGRHVCIRRVRAINWGTRFPDYYFENFVFFLASSPDYDTAVDCAFADCVAEQPSPNNHWNSTIFLVGGNGEENWRGWKGDNYACAIRECYVDARNDYGPVVPIDTISYQTGPGTVKVVTKAPHRHHKPGNLIVQGVSVGGSYLNGYNGTFAIDSIENDTTLYYKLASNPGTASGGAIGGRVSSNDVTLASIAATADSMEFKLTATEPHLRTWNNTITVKGIYNTDTGKASAALNGTFPIVSYDPANPKELIYRINLASDVPSNKLGIFGATIKTGHGATTAENGISEGNRVFHCGSGGPYRDTWSVRSVVARENYYQDVLAGPQVYLSGFSVSTWPWGNGTFGRLRLKSLEYDDSELLCPTVALHSFAQYENSIGIAKVPLPSDPADDPDNPDPYLSSPSVRRHCVLSNDTVRVAASGTDGPIYTGTFKVIETPDAQTFTFELTGTATVPGSAPVFLARVNNTYDDKLYDLRPLQSIASTSLGGGKYKVTATVRKLQHDDEHALEKGEILKIGNVGTYPNRATMLNGNFKITEIVDEKTFCFLVDSAVDPGNPTEPGYYGRIWRCDYWLFENNVVETAIRQLWPEQPTTRDSGLTIGVSGHPSQYPMGQVVIRDNLFRHVNNDSDPNRDVTNYPLPRAMQFWSPDFFGIEDALVQRNIIRLDSTANVPSGARPTPIEFQQDPGDPRGVQTFNNVSADGVIVPAIRDPQFGYAKRPELLSTINQNIDDVLLATFLFSL